MTFAHFSGRRLIPRR